MYAGIFRLEQTFWTVENISTTGDNVLSPDSIPTFSIYSQQGTLLASGTTAAIAGKTGLYSLSVSITSGAGFSSGQQYACVIEYNVSAVAYRKNQTFTVA